MDPTWCDRKQRRSDNVDVSTPPLGRRPGADGSVVASGGHAFNDGKAFVTTPQVQSRSLRIAGPERMRLTN